MITPSSASCRGACRFGRPGQRDRQRAGRRRDTERAVSHAHVLPLRNGSTVAVSNRQASAGDHNSPGWKSPLHSSGDASRLTAFVRPECVQSRGLPNAQFAPSSRLVRHGRSSARRPCQARALSARLALSGTGALSPLALSGTGALSPLALSGTGALSARWRPSARWRHRRSRCKRGVPPRAANSEGRVGGEVRLRAGYNPRRLLAAPGSGRFPCPCAPPPVSPCSPPSSARRWRRPRPAPKSVW